MKIGVIGYGYVGKAMASFYSSRYDIHVFDKHLQIDGDQIDGFTFYSDEKEFVKNIDVGVVCVPTPRGDDGSCDTSIVESVLDWLVADLIIIKSTVPIGFTDSMKQKLNKNIVFSPEYCGESKYWTPYEFHTQVVETPFFVFGGDPKDTSMAVDLYLPIAGPVKRYIQTKAKTAEMAKYMENTFYATKITFCNEMYDICESMGIDWNESREIWLADPRINPMHTAVFKKDRGFGGKCLPKDLSAMISISEKNNTESFLLKAVQKSNENLRKKIP